MDLYCIQSGGFYNPYTDYLHLFQTKWGRLCAVPQRFFHRMLGQGGSLAQCATTSQTNPSLLSVSSKQRSSISPFFHPCSHKAGYVLPSKATGESTCGLCLITVVHSLVVAWWWCCNGCQDPSTTEQGPVARRLLPLLLCRVLAASLSHHLLL